MFVWQNQVTAGQDCCLVRDHCSRWHFNIYKQDITGYFWGDVTKNVKPWQIHIFFSQRFQSCLCWQTWVTAWQQGKVAAKQENHSSRHVPLSVFNETSGTFCGCIVAKKTMDVGTILAVFVATEPGKPHNLFLTFTVFVPKTDHKHRVAQTKIENWTERKAKFQHKNKFCGLQKCTLPTFILAIGLAGNSTIVWIPCFFT